jgi:hypothetical protein
VANQATSVDSTICAGYQDFKMRKCVVLAVLLLMSGCGKGSAPTAHLAGAVMIGGAPIPSDADAALSFKPQNGKAVSVPITNGKYDSPNTPVGSVLVQFYISRRVGPMKTSERTGEKYQDIANLVPPDHAAGMSLEVSKDNLNQDFAL